MVRDIGSTSMRVMLIVVVAWLSSGCRHQYYGRRVTSNDISGLQVNTSEKRDAFLALGRPTSYDQDSGGEYIWIYTYECDFIIINILISMLTAGLYTQEYILDRAREETRLFWKDGKLSAVIRAGYEEPEVDPEFEEIQSQLKSEKKRAAIKRRREPIKRRKGISGFENLNEKG